MVVKYRIEVMDDMAAEVMRKKTGAQRLQIVDDLFVTTQMLIETNVRDRHPEWSARQVSEAIAKRIAGDAD